MEVVMDAFGLKMDDLALAAELKGSEMAQALCDGKIDAMIYTVGHPAAAITEEATTCDVRADSVRQRRPDRQAGRRQPFYRTATIPGGMYKGTDNDTRPSASAQPSSPLPTCLKTSSTRSSRACSTTSTDFKKLHPAFANLKEEEMIKDGLSAPLHPGCREVLQGTRLDVIRRQA
jgi:TRAP transporter TAXI family solute receptor